LKSNLKNNQLTVDVGAARHQFPEHQRGGVGVNLLEGERAELGGALQHLGRHVAQRAHLRVRLARHAPVFALERQPKVGHHRRQVFAQQHVFCTR